MTDEEWEAYMTGSRRFIEGDHRIVILNDNSAGGFPNPAQRAQAAALLEHPKTKDHLAGSGIISTLKLVRGAATAVMWLTKQPVPMKIFANLPDAIAWAETLVPREQKKSS